jgi:hypothetical protein
MVVQTLIVECNMAGPANSLSQSDANLNSAPFTALSPVASQGGEFRGKEVEPGQPDEDKIDTLNGAAPQKEERKKKRRLIEDETKLEIADHDGPNGISKSDSKPDSVSQPE